MDAITRLTEALAGRYSIDRELGRGGMATVLLARDLRHDRQVAIKVLRPELSAILGAERFLHEIKLTANLQHPHIVPLFDSGEAEGLLWYAMPFLEGESLRGRLDREKQLPVEDAVRITRQVAEALEYAHRHNVIHRDIKPENILLLGGTALVADFGIALAVSNAGGHRLTETGLSLGTPYYMSPEQAMGDRQLDARSDVYSLGAVLYEMLTGDPPHTGSTAQAILTATMTEEPRDVRQRRPKIPESVAIAVHRAIEKLPADRFPSAVTFAEALDRSITTALIGPRVSGGSQRRALLLSGAAGLVLGAVGALLFDALTRSHPREPGDARSQITFSGRAWSAGVSPDGQFVAYVEATCRHGSIYGCSFDLLVQEAGSTRPVPVLTKALALDVPHWTRDGQSVVVNAELDSNRVGVFEISRLGGAPQRLTDPGDIDTHPTGDTIVVERPLGPDHTIVQLVAIPSGTVADSLLLPFGGVLSIAWSPDGHHLALARRNKTWIVDREGKTTGSVSFQGRGQVRWSPDGSALMTFRVGRGREDELVRLTVDNAGRIVGNPVVILARVQTLYAGAFDLARRSGRMVLATGSANHDQWVFDLDQRPPRATQVTKGTTWYGIPGVSPDGSEMYYLRGDALGDNLYATRLADSTEEAFTAVRTPGGNAARVSQDGKRLVFESVGDSGMALTNFEVASRRLTRRYYDGWPYFWPLGTTGFIGLDRNSHEPFVLDSAGADPITVPVPDSLRIVTLQPSANAKEMLAAAVAGRWIVLGMVPVPQGGWRELLRSKTEEVGLSAAADGSFYLGQWPAAEAHPSLWRISPSGGPPVRLTDLPAPCSPASIVVASLGHRAACTVEDFRSDIWFVDGVTN